MAESISPGFNWQIPPAAAPESQKIGWLDDAVSQGQAWLKSQRGYPDFRKALDILSGTGVSGPKADYRSRVSTNRLKRNVREITGTMAKLRPTWGYHSDNTAFASNAAMMNKVIRAWYLECFADRQIKQALQYAAATCRGWIRPVYRRDMAGTGHGDIRLLTYGAPCVLPLQLPASGDWQDCYAITILEEMPVWMAHGMWPRYQDRLRPTSSRFWYANDAVRNASKGNLWVRMFGSRASGSADTGLVDLLVPVRYTYVNDLTINRTTQPIPMGEPGSDWSYTVPYIGQDIFMGNDPRSGTPLYRKATENDARLYPYRRLLISTDQCNMYDGPSFDWHGKFPLVSFCPDEWPWEPLGFSLVHDGYELQNAINEIARGNMDKTRASLDLPLAYDFNAVAEKDARGIDPMMPRGRYGYDGAASDAPPFRPTVPDEYYKVTPESMQLWEKFEQVMDSQQAINDVMALAKLRGAGGITDLDKVLEANGPIIEDMSRGMEPPLRDLGVMVKYLILQYYTTARVMQWVGADGVSMEVFDFNPNSLVPSHLPGESTNMESPTSKIVRARTFADNLRFFILPNSLHEITQMAMKLGLIQLRKAGVKISSQTIAESWNVPNYGTIDGNTEIEKWKSEQEMDLEFAARAKELASALGLGGPPGAPGAGGKKSEGRPPSGQAAPKLKDKPTEARSTITESK